MRWWHLPSGLFAVWILSSLSLTDGIYWFGGGILLIGLLALLRNHKPDWVLTVHRLAYSIVFGVALFEAVLWVFPDVIKGELANSIYGGYNAEPDGIYKIDPHLGYVLRPGFGRTMYWNGHWWRHDANNVGYRGPMLEKADAVFLGDSMIYGHGVENDETVSAQFQEIGGGASANLGVQGFNGIHDALQFRRFGVAMKPRLVFLCCHPNDVPDVLKQYPRSEIEHYLAAEPEFSVAPLSSASNKHSVIHNFRVEANRRLNIPLRSAHTIRDLSRLFKSRGWEGFKGGQDSEDWLLPTQATIDEPFDPSRGDEEMQLAWRAHQYAIAQIKADCNRIGAKLVLFDVGYPTDFCEATRKLAGDLGVDYSDAGRKVLAAGQSGRHVYLANDGHWNAVGCRLIAENLAEDINSAQ